MRARSEPRRAPRRAATRAFPARLDQVPRVLAFVAVRSRGLAAERAERLELAVEEWATNVCRHAYEGSEGALEVSVREDVAGLRVELRDEGRPFDPTALPPPDVRAALASRAPGGLGVLLIMRMVDGVTYRREGSSNIVTLVVGRR